MAAIEITGIKDAFKLFEDKLKEAVGTLTQVNQISVKRIAELPTPERPNMPSARGYFGIMYNGENYADDENVKSTTLKMKEDLLIGVVTTIRFIDNENVSVENYSMIPGEYTELARSKLAGIEILNRRPEDEKMIKPINTTMVFEENGIWCYLTTYTIPIDLFET